MRKLLLFFLMASHAFSATWYIDSIATGSGAGTSWANAFTTFALAYSNHGIAAGDTVYISGGPSGSSQTYATTSINSPGFYGQWFWYNKGTIGNVITFQIGQDSLHNGTAILDGQSAATNVATSGVMQDGAWTSPGNGPGWQYITISGNAGDGARHIKFQNYLQGATVSTLWIGVHLTYLDFGQPANALTNGNVIQIASSSGSIEIDHCKVDQSLEVGANAFLTVNASSFVAAYDVDKCHDNVVIEPRDSTNNGYGAKAVLWSASGISIYNNTFTCVPYVGVYSDAQHGDAFFDGPSGAISYIKFYNNRSVDFPNYACYFDMVGNLTHALVYNNVASVSWAGGASQAFVSYGTTSGSVVNTDLQIFNNTADNYASPYNVKNNALYPASDATAFVSCIFANNLEINTGSTGDQIDGAFTKATNSILIGSQGTANFVSYVFAGDAVNNYELKPASGQVGTGTHTYAPATDFNNTARPNPPSVGAFEAYANAAGASANCLVVGGAVVW